MSRVVVVGAGISGLAAAHALRDHDVTVVEGSGRVGGKLVTTAVGDVEVDAGAEAFLVRVPEALDLARAVGLGDELVHPATSTASVWSRGALRPLPRRTFYGVPSSLSSLRGVLSPAEVARGAADLVLPADGGRQDVSVASLVGGRLGRAVVDRLVDPLLGGVYAGRAAELSARATMQPLADARGSLVRTVRRIVPEPAYPPAPVFATVRSGLGTFAERVATASGATMVTGRLVRRIERVEGRFRVVHGSTVDERAIDADAVVVAVPAAPAARLLADLAPAAATDLAVVETASLALVTTVWPAADVPPMAGSGYLVPAVANRPVKAVTFSSAKWAHVGAPGLAVARASFGRHGDSDVFQRTDEDLVDLAVEELATVAGFGGRPVATRVTRWGGGLPQYAVGHVERVARIRSSVAAVPGLAVCGATYDGVGIPACIRSGLAAAAQVRQALAP
jgi:protoporphyrinogen/coproporphyrinogen III oxidase